MCWHRIKLLILTVTCLDSKRKEERLAKAKVWNQKHSSRKGSRYSFLSLGLNDFRKELSFRRKLSKHMRKIDVKGAIFEAHTEKQQIKNVKWSHSITDAACLSVVFYLYIFSLYYFICSSLEIIKQHKHSNSWKHTSIFQTTFISVPCTSLEAMYSPRLYLQHRLWKGFHHILFSINKSYLWEQ